MRRIKQTNIKTGVVIFVFSLLLTTAFTLTLAWVQSSTNKVTISDGILYPITEMDYSKIVKSGGTLKIDMNNVVGTKDYSNQYVNKLLSGLFPISLLFLVLLFFLSVGLWFVLKRMQNKDTLNIVQQLNSAVSDSVTSDDPVLSLAYAHLKEKFDDRLEDYKRLNSYLSHEQKNALAILRTSLELSENQEYVKNIDYISDSIDDVLTLSENIEMSALAPVDISLVCAEVCDSYAKLSKQITFEFNENDHTEILAKKRWIYRAVANLLDNAIKYGENKPISVTVKADKGSVIIMVKDNGMGISYERQDKIFHNRYRVNELNKNGYGIGLSLVSHVCDLCGGFVMVESEPGQGATFYLSFSQETR